jgi:hypothetical protein
MNNIALTTALATAPTTAFAELRERPASGFRCWFAVLSTVAVVYWYYSVVVIEWMKETIYANSADFQKLPEADPPARALGMLTRTTFAV